MWAWYCRTDTHTQDLDFKYFKKTIEKQRAFAWVCLEYQMGRVCGLFFCYIKPGKLKQAQIKYWIHFFIFNIRNPVLTHKRTSWFLMWLTLRKHCSSRSISSLLHSDAKSTVNSTSWKPQSLWISAPWERAHNAATTFSKPNTKTAQCRRQKTKVPRWGKRLVQRYHSSPR